MPDSNCSVCFTIKWRKDYRVKKKTRFLVREIGRYFKENPVDIETWCKASGDCIPNECTIPLVNPPKSLPLSLKLNRWVKNDEHLCLDVTNPQLILNCFKVTPPPKEMPESLPPLFSIEKCLTWAIRENIDLANVHFFIANDALKKIASSGYHRKHSCWEWSVLFYKGKIFIDDGYIKENEKFWLKGLSKPEFDYQKTVFDPLDSLADFDFHCNDSELDGSVPHCRFSTFFAQQQELEKYRKKFTDVMRCGGPGDPLYGGEDTDVRSVMLFTLENLSILTSTRRGCCMPDSDRCGDSHVEIETMFPWDPLLWEKFEKFKSCSLWINCALTGASAVYCGFRTADGTLKEIKKYTIRELAEIGKKYWTPDEILTYLDTIFNWLKKKFNKNPSRMKHGEEWLISELDCKEGSTFTLSSAEDGFIRLTPCDYPEFRKVIAEKYECVLKNANVKHDRKKSASSVDYNVDDGDDGDDGSDEDNVPDTWDDSD